MFGLTFNGKHSYKDFGLIMLSKNRPILPEIKEVVEEVSGDHGELDYSDINPDNEVKYKAITQEVEFNFDRNKINWRDPRAIRYKARLIAAWLACGTKPLVFDDEPDKFYNAKVSNKLDLENQIQSGRPFTVNFKSGMPFAIQRDRTDSIKLNSKILLRTPIRLNDKYSYTVTDDTSININNFGTYRVKPVIRITGSLSSISITIGNKTITYAEALTNETLEIDCYLGQVKKGTALKNLVTYGEFLILEPGVNYINISGTGLDCTVSFVFNPLYI